MKKFVALLLAFVMCLSLFAGCNKAPVQEEPTPAPTNAGNESTQAPDTTEEVKEFSYPTSGSLTFWQWVNGNVSANYSTFEETPAAAWAEAATGVKVDYIDDHSNTDEAFQLMISDKMLPDIIGHTWGTYNGGVVAAYEEGIIIRLNDVIDQYMPNLKAYLDANPDIRKQMADDEGNIYYLCTVNSADGVYTNGSYIRTDMLESVGGEIPTTIDGWHDLLVALKEKHGYAPWTSTWAELLTKSFMANAYGISDDQYSNYDGTAVYNRTSDNYKAFLETMNAWYEEGLIDADIASIASADARAKIINGEAAVHCGWLGSQMQLIEQNSSEWGLQAFPTPALTEGGVAEFAYAAWQVSTQGVAISTSCENVELAARWLDYFYSEEGMLLANFGKEGESYTMVDGKPVFTDSVINNANGWTVSQSIGAINFNTNGFICGVKYEGYYPQTLVEQSCKDAIAIWSSVNGGGYLHKWPNVTFTADEATEVARYSANLKTTADEWALNFILGNVEFDQWDTYVAEMEAMGANEALAINQAALDRYLNR